MVIWYPIDTNQWMNAPLLGNIKTLTTTTKYVELNSIDLAIPVTMIKLIMSFLISFIVCYLTKCQKENTEGVLIIFSFLNVALLYLLWSQVTICMLPVASCRSTRSLITNISFLFSLYCWNIYLYIHHRHIATMSGSLCI